MLKARCVSYITQVEKSGPGLIRYNYPAVLLLDGFRHTAAPSILVGLISDRLVQIVNPFGPGSVRSR